MHREPIEGPDTELLNEWPANGQQRNFYRSKNNLVAKEGDGSATLRLLGQFWTRS